MKPDKKKNSKKQALKMTEKDLKCLLMLSKKELSDSRKKNYRPEFS
ncbi:hypothetical protein NX722_28465 [Endozoicomonas gorgoniicola]|uniref:Uncharacterized protein n=1 Tax=Endozoicomonas gorgoniicola TaxID=1234144 RepID=A0ABT3N4D2_9GAMM|nr:hypothetical protein [Endozoicomonas gorgoniicola]MCW7556501.1 hypothetical protein [Endozoicomonas gorgoniicola]